MDAKALAKSKRAHSLHHKKKHQTHQGLKVPSVASDDKKAAGKQATEKSHGQQTKETTPQYQGRSRALPSNWDRYDEDLDLASETSSSQPTEFVMPKSKGADYAHLISEAKVESQSRYSSEILPLFDDYISDFMQDFGPMLAAKGQSMLSWVTDDGFELEDKASISPQAPFLSLNLNALAEQLAKAKLSERLYLQSDLLPLELLDEACDGYKTSAAETDTLSSSLSNDQAVTASGDLLVQISEEELYPVKENKDQILQPRATNRSILPKLVREHPTHSSSGKPSTFKAVNAEAELDMLLNSFGDAAIPEPSGASLTGIPSSDASVKKGVNMLNPAIVDADVDILLEETSSLTIADQQIPHVSKTKTEGISSSKNPISKSEIVDDFDSWLDTI